MYYASVLILPRGLPLVQYDAASAEQVFWTLRCRTLQTALEATFYSNFNFFIHVKWIPVIHLQSSIQPKLIWRHIWDVLKVWNNFKPHISVVFEVVSLVWRLVLSCWRSIGFSPNKCNWFIVFPNKCNSFIVSISLQFPSKSQSWSSYF